MHICCMLAGIDSGENKRKNKKRVNQTYFHRGQKKERRKKAQNTRNAMRCRERISRTRRQQNTQKLKIGIHKDARAQRKCPGILRFCTFFALENILKQRLPIRQCT